MRANLIRRPIRRLLKRAGESSLPFRKWQPPAGGLKVIGLFFGNELRGKA